MNKFAVCGAVLSLITLVGVAGLKSAKTNGAGVVSDNVAGSYVDYDTETYIDWSTGGAILQNKFMYKYTTIRYFQKYVGNGKRGVQDL